MAASSREVLLVEPSMIRSATQLPTARKRQKHAATIASGPRSVPANPGPCTEAPLPPLPPLPEGAVMSPGQLVHHIENQDDDEGETGGEGRGDQGGRAVMDPAGEVHRLGEQVRSISWRCSLAMPRNSRVCFSMMSTTR